MREGQLLSPVALPRSADVTPSVPTAARTVSTTRSPLVPNSSTLITSLISPTRSLLLTLVPSLHGRTPRRSWRWILLVTWLRGFSRT